MFQTITTINSMLLGAEFVMFLTCACMIWRRRVNWKSWSFIFFTTFIVVTWSWRLLLGIISSRYALVLAFPAVLGTVYFLYAIFPVTELWRQKMPKLVVFLEKNKSGIVRCIVIVLLAAFLGKSLHCNPYQKSIINVMSRLDKEIHSDRNVLVYNYFDTRLRYYIPHADSKNVFLMSEDLSRKNIETDIKRHPQAKVIFFIGKISKKIDESKDFCNFLEKYSIVKVADTWYNRRKRNKFVLYKYTRGSRI